MYDRSVRRAVNRFGECSQTVYTPKGFPTRVSLPVSSSFLVHLFSSLSCLSPFSFASLVPPCFGDYLFVILVHVLSWSCHTTSDAICIPCPLSTLVYPMYLFLFHTTSLCLVLERTLGEAGSVQLKAFLFLLL